MVKPSFRLKVEAWPVEALAPALRNPREHPVGQLAALKNSILAFGFNNPILASSDGSIIAGEARWLVAGDLGMAQVPVIVLDHLSENERQAYALADNKIPLGGVWDEEMLGQIMADLEAVAFDISLTGFSDGEIDDLLALAAGDVLEDLDQAPPPPVVAVSQIGDVWELGEHRLICGDSTKTETFEKLLSGQTAGSVVCDMVFTDPPYGMAYDGGRALREAPGLVFTDPPYGMSFGAGKEAGSTAKGSLVKAHGQIIGDDARGEDLVNLVGEALKRAHEVAWPEAAFYVCFTWRTYCEFERGLKEAGLNIAACIVWDKGSIGLGHQHYRPQHEFIFYCKGANWNGGKGESDIWEFSRGHTESYVHPTQKPVDLIKRAIGNSSRRGDLVLDLFGGSGSTVIACEAMGRRARVVELDPKYCDVIACRWQQFAGGAARLLGDGQSFDETALSRKNTGTIA